MVADPKARLKEIIDGYLDRDGGIGVDTGIVAGHLAQMKLFGIRKGVEFFPAKITSVLSVRITWTVSSNSTS